MYTSDQLAEGLNLARAQMDAAKTDAHREYWQVVVDTMLQATISKMNAERNPAPAKPRSIFEPPVRAA